MIQRLGPVQISLFAVAAFAVFAGTPFWFFPQEDVARAVANCLSAGIAGAAATAGLMQYHRNSRDKRIERSMEFWRRSNSGEVKDDLNAFIDHWRKLPPNEVGAYFRNLGSTPDDEHNQDHAIKVKIEQLLDFYDEACSAVALGACDDTAMYFYLGPLMIRHAERLESFIEEWRKEKDRTEKWDCFTSRTSKWKSARAKYDAQRRKFTSPGQWRWWRRRHSNATS